MTKISQKKIGRLSLYRRLLGELKSLGQTHIYSYQLANIANASAAQVRRDLMAIGYKGNPAKGYEINELAISLANFLDAEEAQKVALVGVGRLGVAILNFFNGRRPKLKIVAAFDLDPSKFQDVHQLCPCYGMDEMEKMIERNDIEVGIIAVPAPVAQEIAQRLYNAGVRGILNFAPAPIKCPDDAHVEHIDMTMSLEKVAYFSRISQHPELNIELVSDSEASQSSLLDPIE